MAVPLPRGWACYSAWNQAIRDNLFDGRAAGSPVYLDLDGRYLAEADAQASSSCPDHTGDARDRLIRSLRGTLEDRKDVFKRHRSQAQYWKKDNLDKDRLEESPPFLALLMVFVAVAEEMAGDGIFEANDYFGRLTNRLNAALSTTYSKGVIQQSYYDHIDGKSSQDAGLVSLWLLLNQWLEANDYELGMPTAYPVGGLPYVSVPVSQALIRTSDRSDLHRLFAKHFGEMRSPTPEEMTAVLSVSLTCPPFSRTLTNMWARKESRERIARLALAELASWDSVWEEPSGAAGMVRLAAPLLLRGRLRGGPMRSLRLSLTARCSSRLLGEYRLPPGTPAQVRRCLVEGFNAVRLQASLTGSALADMVPGEAIDIEEVLVRHFESFEMVSDWYANSRP